MITKQDVVNKLEGYLEDRLSLEELVNWAEHVFLDDEPLSESEASTLSEVLARLGLADVRQFGLTWHDMRDMLDRLGYHAHVVLQVG